MAQNPASFTGQFLKPILEKAGTLGAASAGTSAAVPAKGTRATAPAKRTRKKAATSALANMAATSDAATAIKAAAATAAQALGLEDSTKRKPRAKRSKASTEQ